MSTGTGLTFARLLRSEWIKLRSLRSTAWCAGLILIFIVGLAALLSAVISVAGMTALDEQRGFTVTIVTAGLLPAQIVVAVIGVLVITGEYGTGMIRSTFTAAPRRVRSMSAKLIVLVATTLLLSGFAVVVAADLATVLLARKSVGTHLLDPLVAGPLVGAAVYLALIAAFAFCIGALLRNAAAGISITLGALVVLPAMLGVISVLTGAVWITTVSDFLPAAAGARLYAYIPSVRQSLPDTLALEPWQGLLVLLGWIIVLGVPAALLIRRRDA